MMDVATRKGIESTAMLERFQQREAPSASAVTGTAVIAGITAMFSGSAHDALAQKLELQPNAPLVKEHQPQLLPWMRAKYISDLGHDDFQTREIAYAELSKHVKDRSTLKALFLIIENTNATEWQSKKTKQPPKDYNVEQLQRTKQIAGKELANEKEKYRGWKLDGQNPYSNFLPDGAQLPPGLEKLIEGKDAFDVQFFWRNFDDVQNVEDPPGVLHGTYIRGFYKFVALYEHYAHLDAFQSENYEKTMQQWSGKLAAIREAWMTGKKYVK